MVQVAGFSNSVEAEMAMGFLQNQGIECQVVGAKEYASHVVGGTIGNYRLLVKPEQVPLAEGLLKGLQQPSENAADSETSKAKGQHVTADLFQKAVVLSLISFFMLPVIGNIFAVYNAVVFIRGSEKSTLNLLKFTYIMALQILFLMGAYHLYTRNS